MSAKRDQEFWNSFYLSMAKLVATASKDPTTQVGAVLVSFCRRKMAIGYNGFPGALRDDERLHDRELKRKLTLHAEDNAIGNADFDTKTTPCRLYVTGHPCHDCAVRIVREPGIKEVIHSGQTFHPDWQDSFQLAEAVLSEAGVVLLGTSVPRRPDSSHVPEKRRVRYTPTGELGILTRVSQDPRLVFVMYGLDTHSKATKWEDLELLPAGQEES